MHGNLSRGLHRLFRHWRAIILVLILIPAALLIADSAFFDLTAFALLLVFIASQLFWVGRVVDLGLRFTPGKSSRVGLTIIAVLIYLFVFIYSYPSTVGQSHVFRPADYRIHSVAIEAAFWLWFVGSMLGFAIWIALWGSDRATRAVVWLFRKARAATQGRGAGFERATSSALSAERRRFLEQTAVLLSATPFVAAGYGLFHGRTDVEVVRQRIGLARLPKAFEGFRIAQLSDMHIGPFASADYIRHCVSITNELKPDLVALTGDYIAWDTQAAGEVVRELAALHAPSGVFGCLGNHEQEGEIEDSVTRAFAAYRVRILRQERAAIQFGGQALNLIGMDEPHGTHLGEWRKDVQQRLRMVQDLTIPGTVNILLLHYPAIFDHMADLNIDLVLAGHTHGGQVSLDLIRRGLNPSRMVTRYTNGWYEKAGVQLYVNRGIGTTGFPIRLGARPEITVFQLVGA